MFFMREKTAVFACLAIYFFRRGKNTTLAKVYTKIFIFVCDFYFTSPQLKCCGLFRPASTIEYNFFRSSSING